MAEVFLASFNPQQLARIKDGLAGLNAQAVARAGARALNRANGSARTVMVRAVAQDLKLKVSDVRDLIAVQDASPTRLEARLVPTRPRIPVITFNARGPEPSRGKGRGVSARTPAGRYPKAFIATMSSGHRGVFQRVGTARLPIRELYGPSVAAVFKKYHALGLGRGVEQLRKNLLSELRFERLRKAS